LVADLPVRLPTSGALPVLLGRVLGDLVEREQEAVSVETFFVVLDERTAGSLSSFDTGDMAWAATELSSHLSDGDPGQFA
jgi:hypothetical protein